MPRLCRDNVLTPGHPDLAHIISAMLAGASGTILTNPLWVVKTRFMVSLGRLPSAMATDESPGLDVSWCTAHLAFR